jgi:arylsulfatase A-like enzyme
LRINTSLTGKEGIPSYQKLDGNSDFYYYVSQYEGEIRYQDASFGQLLEAIKKLGIYDKSVIILSSDHGECLGEHDFYFCHGENMYQPLLRVPLIIKYPDEKPRNITNTAQHIDLFPTILKLIGRSPENNLRGRDLRNLTGEKRDIFSEIDSEKIMSFCKNSLISGNLKLIYSFFPYGWELYDLAEDPAEKNNLVDKPEYSGQVKDLKGRMHRLVNEDLLNIKPVKRQEISEQERKNLESLGYVE